MLWNRIALSTRPLAKQLLVCKATSTDTIMQGAVQVAYQLSPVTRTSARFVSSRRRRGSRTHRSKTRGRWTKRFPRRLVRTHRTSSMSSASVYAHSRRSSLSDRRNTFHSRFRPARHTTSSPDRRAPPYQLLEPKQNLVMPAPGVRSQISQRPRLAFQFSNVAIFSFQHPEI